MTSPRSSPGCSAPKTSARASRTASTGGVDGYGTLFSVDSSGDFQTLYSFTGGQDGGTPVGSLEYSGNGQDLVGVTSTGGLGDGTIYEFNLESDQFAGAYDFPDTGTYGLSGSQPIVSSNSFDSRFGAIK